MKEYTVKIMMGIGVLLFFLVFFANAETCLQNNNCSRNSDEIAARDIFTERRVERESRTVNIRGKVGSERLVNNRRIVDSDSRLSNFPDRLLNDIGRSNTNGRRTNSEVQRSTRLGDRLQNLERRQVETNSNRIRVTRSAEREAVATRRSGSERIPTIKNRIREASHNSENVRNSERTFGRSNKSRLSAQETPGDHSKIFRTSEGSNHGTERLYGFVGRQDNRRGVSYNQRQLRNTERTMIRRNNEDIERIREVDNIHDTSFAQTRRRLATRDAERYRNIEARITEKPVANQFRVTTELRGVRDAETTINKFRNVNKLSERFRIFKKELKERTNSDRVRKTIITERRGDVSRLPISGNTHNLRIIRNRFELERRDFEKIVRNRLTARVVREIERARISEGERSFLPDNGVENKVGRSRIGDNGRNLPKERKRESRKTEISGRAESERINLRLNVRDPQDFEASKNENRENVVRKLREERDLIDEGARNRIRKISDSQWSVPQHTRWFKSQNAIRVEENKQGNNVFWSNLLTALVGIILMGQMVYSNLDSKRFYHIRNLVSATKEKIC